MAEAEGLKGPMGKGGFSNRILLVLTGVPGVGKSSVARILSKRLKGTHIDLTELTLKENLNLGFDEERGVAIADLEIIRRRVKEIYDTSEGPIIVEGHFAHDVVPAKMASMVFVLRRAPWRLKSELERRGYGRMKVRENVEAELLDVSLVEALEAYGEEIVCEIDTTSLAIEEAAEEILSILEGRIPCRRGFIDWLGHPMSKMVLEDP
ncbi:adenylate kinase family protein [Candidatus Bathyarchaeota archaeon]|nr:adenylate kinase family protein [Candidatus Bathyarchaeota archaeon]